MKNFGEKIARGIETIKQGAKEMRKAFSEKFENAKKELAEKVLGAKSPEDMIALGKKLQEQGEALKAEEVGVKQEELSEDHSEGLEMNAAFDKDKAHGEAMEMNAEFKKDKDHEEALGINKEIDEAKAAEVRAQEKAKFAEEARLSAEADKAAAAEILKKLQGGDAETAPVKKAEAVATEKATLAEATVEKSESKEIPPEVQQVIKKMERAGYYGEDISKLKPGEAPSKELTTKMIDSIIMSGDNTITLDFARILMENLPFDSENVKKYAEKEIMEEQSIDERRIKALELVGIDPKTLHNKALEKLPRLLSLATREYRTPETVQKWRETFNISKEEHTEALHKYYNEHKGEISAKQLRALGFIVTNATGEKIAWDKSI